MTDLENKLSKKNDNFFKKHAYLFKNYVSELLTEINDLIFDILMDICELGPVPQTFDYSYSFVSYFWSVIFMTSKTIGHRLARLFVIHILLNLINKIILIFIVYMFLPVFIILIDSKISYKKFPLAQRRISIILLCFVIGLFSEHIWIHWIHIKTSEPSYYFPAVVGLLLQVMGPMFEHNRLLFWLATIGFPSLLSIAIGMRMKILGFKYLIGTLFSIAQSIISLQMLIGEFKRRKLDEIAMSSNQLKTLIISIYIHAILTFFNATYDPLNLNTTDL